MLNLLIVSIALTERRNIMPIKIQNELPAKHELEEENIFVMDESRALSQDFRELQIAILNLMPIKQDTELQLLRALSNTPLQIDVTFIQAESHVSKNTSHSHIKKFYETFSSIKDKNFDGLIITGAPVEKLDFEEVNYWDELTTIMEWSKEHVTSTLHICWGEAYPGDVFYLHSRLLERSSRLSPEAGGGSITALPIIETQAGDLSAYIPTNVISITDGQIFLESELFFSGQRPAVNVGLSVSRVGGAAQTKAMKKAAGSIRIDLAQYREMEVFTQFSSDLDEGTMKQLQHGRALMELLKQPMSHPFSMAEQVIILVSANAHIFSDIELSKIKGFRADMLEFFHSQHSEIVNTIESTKDLTDETKEAIIAAANEFKSER